MNTHLKNFGIPKTSNLFPILFLTLSLVALTSCKQENQTKQLEAKNNLTNAYSVKTLKLDLNENDMNNSIESFAYTESGHFGDKTQYNGREADEFGGAYAVHCKKGKIYSIEIKYAKTIKRKDALEIVRRILPVNIGKEIEHDKDDLEKKDVIKAAEFFYYAGDQGVELDYAPNSIGDIAQINIWTKPNTY